MNNNKNNKNREGSNTDIKTSKNLRKIISIDNKLLSSKLKRIMTLNLNKLEKEKEISEKKIRKKRNKNKTSPNNEKLFKNHLNNNNSDKVIHNKENKENKENKVKVQRKRRENTFVNRSSDMKIKDCNIKAYRTSLFNKNSSSNVEAKIEPNLIIKDEKEKNNKNKKKAIKYNGFSHKLLYFGLNIKNKDENK